MCLLMLKYTAKNVRPYQLPLQIQAKSSNLQRWRCRMILQRLFLLRKLCCALCCIFIGAFGWFMVAVFFCYGDGGSASWTSVSFSLGPIWRRGGGTERHPNVPRELFGWWFNQEMFWACQLPSPNSAIFRGTTQAFLVWRCVFLKLLSSCIYWSART